MPAEIKSLLFRAKRKIPLLLFCWACYYFLAFYSGISRGTRNDKKKFLPVISNERSEEKSLNYCPVVIVSAAKNPFKQKKLIVTTRLYSIGYYFFSQPIRYVLFPINNNIN